MNQTIINKFRNTHLTFFCKTGFTNNITTVCSLYDIRRLIQLMRSNPRTVRSDFFQFFRVNLNHAPTDNDFLIWKILLKLLNFINHLVFSRQLNIACIYNNNISFLNGINNIYLIFNQHSRHNLRISLIECATVRINIYFHSYSLIVFLKMYFVKS